MAASFIPEHFVLKGYAFGWGRIMISEWKYQWESMTIDDRFALREQMQEVPSAKLLAKKVTLERRLQSLNQLSSDVEATNRRRP